MVASSTRLHDITLQKTAVFMLTVNNLVHSQYNIPLFIPLHVSARAGHPQAQKLCKKYTKIDVRDLVK